MYRSKRRYKGTEWIILVKYGVLGRTEAKTELDKMANFLSATLTLPIRDMPVHFAFIHRNLYQHCLT
jgi:hypothetical protein